MRMRMARRAPPRPTVPPAALKQPRRVCPGSMPFIIIIIIILNSRGVSPSLVWGWGTGKPMLAASLFEWHRKCIEVRVLPARSVCKARTSALMFLKAHHNIRESAPFHCGIAKRRAWHVGCGEPHTTYRARLVTSASQEHSHPDPAVQDKHTFSNRFCQVLTSV